MASPVGRIRIFVDRRCYNASLPQLGKTAATVPRFTFHKADPARATASVLALISGEINEESFANWLKDNVTALEY